MYEIKHLSGGACHAALFSGELFSFSSSLPVSFPASLCLFLWVLCLFFVPVHSVFLYYASFSS